MGTPRLVLGHSNALGEHPLYDLLAQCPLSLQPIDASDPLPDELALVLLDEWLLALRPLADWLDCGAILVGCMDQPGVLPLPPHASVEELAALLRFAGEQYSLRHQTEQLAAALAGKHDDLSKLVDVGLALSAERDLDRLLEKILIEGRRLSNSDAASLFLVSRRPDAPAQLIFKLTQNGTLSQNSFQDQRMPLSKASIAGYVALTSTELNIEDVYAIAADAPYRFNRSFDLQMGYRTMSILAGARLGDDVRSGAGGAARGLRGDTRDAYGRYEGKRRHGCEFGWRCGPRRACCCGVVSERES